MLLIVDVSYKVSAVDFPTSYDISFFFFATFKSLLYHLAVNGMYSTVNGTIDSLDLRSRRMMKMNHRNLSNEQIKTMVNLVFDPSVAMVRAVGLDFGLLLDTLTNPRDRFSSNPSILHNLNIIFSRLTTALFPVIKAGFENKFGSKT